MVNIIVYSFFCISSLSFVFFSILLVFCFFLFFALSCFLFFLFLMAQNQVSYANALKRSYQTYKRPGGELGKSGGGGVSGGSLVPRAFQSFSANCMMLDFSGMGLKKEEAFSLITNTYQGIEGVNELSTHRRVYLPYAATLAQTQTSQGTSSSNPSPPDHRPSLDQESTNLLQLAIFDYVPKFGPLFFFFFFICQIKKKTKKFGPPSYSCLFFLFFFIFLFYMPDIFI